MVEPYASLVPLILGCIGTIGTMWLIGECTKSDALKAKRRKLLNPTTIFMWIVVVAFGLASLTISKAGEGAVWLFLLVWLLAGGLAGVVIIKVIEHSDLDNNHVLHSRLFCAWSIIGMSILSYGMWSFGSDTTAPKGDTPISVEYSVAPDGSIVTHPKEIQDDIMYVELDGGIEASITLGKDFVEISAYDPEEDLTLDVVATDEVRELIEYFETI